MCASRSGVGVRLMRREGSLFFPRASTIPQSPLPSSAPHAFAKTSSVTVVVPTASELVSSARGFLPPGLFLNWPFLLGRLAAFVEFFRVLHFCDELLLLVLPAVSCHPLLVMLFTSVGVWKTLCIFSHDENLLSFQEDCWSSTGSTQRPCSWSTCNTSRYVFAPCLPKPRRSEPFRCCPLREVFPYYSDQLSLVWSSGVGIWS